LKLNVVESVNAKVTSSHTFGEIPTAMDTGASTHTCGDPEVLDSDTRYEYNVRLKMADGALVDASIRGDVLINKDSNLSTIILRDMLHVPGAELNLISIGTLDLDGWHTHIGDGVLQVYDPQTAEIAMVAILGSDKLYYWDPNANCQPLPQPSAYSAREHTGEVPLIDVWRRRLAIGHLNEAYIRKCKKIPIGEFLSYCDACAFAKAHRKSWRAVSNKDPNFLDELHGDCAGPMSTESVARKNYFYLFVETRTKKQFVFFLRYKSECHQSLRVIVEYCKTQGGTYPKLILTDGGEMNSTETKTYLEEKGIKYRTTGPKGHNQNPIVDRAIRTVEEGANAMMYQANAPSRFWHEAIEYKVYINNRILTRGLTDPETGL
jgi:hypothetical protein